MNIKSNQQPYLGVVLAGLLAACSGGGINISAEGPTITGISPVLPTPMTEAITTYGVITGLNDVVVNDVRYTANGATVTINGQPGTISDLKRGQIVTLQGRIDGNGNSGTANSIRFDANLIGPVQSLDAADSRLIVMGQTVITDPDTMFATGIDPATFAGLSIGGNVQVSGFTDAAGVIHATRIDPDSSSSELQLIGKVAGIDLANLLFTINRLTFDYSGAVLIQLPGGAPSNGMKIKAIGTMSGGLFIVENLLTAPGLESNTSGRVQVAGMITRFNSSSDFDINGASAAIGSTTMFISGDAANLALNAEIVLDGDFATGGHISANRITFGHNAGDTATLVYGFSGFTEISLPTVFNVMVTQGPEFSVEVIVDEDIASRVDVTQTGSRLNIALLMGNNNANTLEAFVTMPVLDKIDLTGVVNVMLNDFDQPQMTVNVGGVSRLHGNALSIDSLTATVTGVSQLGFGDIHPIGNANINVSGVSLATLNMDVGSTLTGSVATGQGTGVSTLFYYGTNVNLNVSNDFTSTVMKLGETRP
jgi:hypothetical protein